MKISVLKENLSKALNIVNHAVTTKSNLEVLNNILLKTEEGRIKLEATNLEIGISIYLGGKIEKKGEITIPARLFLDLINTIPHQKVDLELKDNLLLNVKSENFESNIKGLKADEFPIIPEIKKGTKFNIKTKDLKEAIIMSAFAAATDESRPVLSGVFLEVVNKKLVFAATDSYRLTEKILTLGSGENFKAIVPQKSFIELSRILEDYDKDIEVMVDENQILFKTQDLEFTSRLIEGEYPDYKKIIPENLETTAEIKKDELLDSVKAASLFSRQSGNSVCLNLHANKGEVEISSPESAFGDSIAFIKSEIKGKGGEIVFNSRYLLDFLNNVKEETILFKMNDKINPGTFQTPKEKDYIYIIMPLRS